MINLFQIEVFKANYIDIFHIAYPQKCTYAIEEEKNETSQQMKKKGMQNFSGDAEKSESLNVFLK